MIHLLIKHCSFKALLCSLLFAVPLALLGQQTLYYDRDNNPGWYDASGWSLTDDPPTFDEEWVDGSIAVFGSGGSIDFNVESVPPTISSDPVLVNGLFNDGSRVNFIGSGTIPITVSFVGRTRWL